MKYLLRLLLVLTFVFVGVSAAEASWQFTKWQYQLTGVIDQTVPVPLYITDGFDTPVSTIQALHAQGKKVICYFSAGSYESWRSDAYKFPAAALGKSNGWPGERWLDIRRLDLIGNIMYKRLEGCKAKGFDGIDPDNVDGYMNNTGFPLTAADQLSYNRLIANTAHALGLPVGLKNDLGQVPQLASLFDFAVVEQCFQFNECNKLAPFTALQKPVFSVEYSGTQAAICPQANALGIMTMLKPLDLGAPVTWKCWS